MADTVDMHRSGTNSIRKLHVREDKTKSKIELYKKNVKLKKKRIHVQAILSNLLSRSSFIT